MKKYLLSLIALPLFLSCLTGCSDSNGTVQSEADSFQENSSADSAAPIISSPDYEKDEKQENDISLEPAVSAESGDAYLFICDEAYYLNYDGTADTLLSFSAVCTPVKENGTYTVSVTTDSKACRLAATGDMNSNLNANGIAYAAVAFRDGALLYPDLSVSIDSISVNGKEIPLTGLNVTLTPDGNDLRAEIFSTFDRHISSAAEPVITTTSTTTLTETTAPASGTTDTETTATTTTTEETTVTTVPQPSTQIVEPSAFTDWKTVEVTFSVSGI